MVEKIGSLGTSFPLFHEVSLCRCSECQRLKDTEDKWMCRLGTLDTATGLNNRDEMQSRVRVNFRQSRVGGT